jgi:prolyl oligopeptidase
MLTTCLLASASSAEDLPVQPVAAVRVVETKLPFASAVDPYRWMEDSSSSEFVSWADGQSAYTHALLAKHTNAAELFKRVSELASARDEVIQIRRRADSIIYLKRPAKANTFKLFVRNDKGGPEKLLFDPTAIGKNASIDFHEPSPNGRYDAFGVSASGSEESTLLVVDAASGRTLSERIGNTRGAMPQWRPDSQSFFYMRHPQVDPGAPAAARAQKRRSYLHRVGAGAERDVAVFGYEVSPLVPVGLNDSTWARAYFGSPYALAIARRGPKNDRAIYVAPLASVVDGNTPWKKIADIADNIDDYTVHGHDLYVLTHREASRGKVLRTSLDAPDLARAEVIIPPSSAIIEELGGAKDALYVRMNEGGLGRIVRVPYDGSAKSTLSLPLAGIVDGFSADPSAPGVTFQMESWTHPGVAFEYDPASGGVADLGVLPPASTPPVTLESKRVMVASADGTQIPLTLVHRRGLDLGVPHPTVLTAYGSYGSSFDPYFDPRQFAWYERDGVYAVAHVRGGGEFGEEWHLAGMKQNKQHSIDDFVACARYLAQAKVTSRALLAADAGSAGGIVIAGAITQHPELFAAAVIHAGIVDPIRFEHTALGGTNAVEFGSAANPTELASLYAMSAYYHVADKTAYPAVLFTGGMHDTRVPLWQGAKMAARLQAATTSGKPILLRVEHEGGHGYSSDAQYNAETADSYAFLFWQLGPAATSKHAARR